jgi:anti-sigma B factor antagonist
METRIESVLAEDDTATVALHGEIDFSNADDVAQAIRDAIAEWSPAEVRIDLRSATFIDSTGLGALIEGYRATTEAACRFVVTNPNANFRRVLTVTGLCDLFGLGDRDEPAGTAFSSTSATGA